MTELSTAEAGPTKARLSPRKRRRLIRGVQYVVFVAVLAALILSANWEGLVEDFLDIEAAKQAFPELITVALKNTVIFTLAGYAIGFVLGLVIALMRLSTSKPFRIFAMMYIEVFRGLPLLVVILLIAFALPVAFPDAIIPFDPYGTVAIALGLPAAAYMAESFRAGIQAVPKGQMEAARSLGMPYMRAMTSIIVPQAIRIVIPPLTNELILLFKDSSLVYAIGVTASTVELTKFGSDLQNQLADTTPLVVAGAAYLLITVPASYFVRRLELKQQRGRN